VAKRSFNTIPLRRSEQLVVGTLVAAALVLLGIYGWQTSQQQKGWIEIDRAEPLAAEFQVDVNRAQWSELAQLPGIGETIARRIVASREEEGPYLGQEDLRRVRGIGPKTMERLRPYLLPMPPGDAIVER